MWNTVKIGDVCDLMTGGTPDRKKPEYFSNGHIKWLVSGDINQRVIFDCSGRITEAGLRNSNAKFLKEDSVLVALNGQGKTRGTVALLRTQATCNQSLVAIHPKQESELDTKFLFYVLDGMYDRIRRITGDAGNDRRGLNMPLIRNIYIPYPPIAEQKRIVAKLDAAFAEIDAAISSCERNVLNAERLYSYGIDKVFSPLFNLAQPLGNNSKINYGYTAKASFSEGTHKFLRITDIQNNSVDWNGVPFCNIEETKLPKMLLHDGDIVFARTGATTGKSFLVENPTKAVFASYLIRVSIDRDILLPRYVMHFFQSETYWLQVNEGISGAAQGGFNATKLAELKVPIIPIEEQQNVINRLDVLCEQTTKLAAIYQKKVAQKFALKAAILAQELQSEAA